MPPRLLTLCSLFHFSLPPIASSLPLSLLPSRSLTPAPLLPLLSLSHSLLPPYNGRTLHHERGAPSREGGALSRAHERGARALMCSRADSLGTNRPTNRPTNKQTNTPTTALTVQAHKRDSQRHLCQGLRPPSQRLQARSGGARGCCCTPPPPWPRHAFARKR